MSKKFESNKPRRLITVLLMIILAFSMASCSFSQAGGDDNSENSDTPYIGENGNWWVGNRDTGVSAEGKSGKDGTDGNAPVFKFDEADKTLYLSYDGITWTAVVDLGSFSGAGTTSPTLRINNDGMWEASYDGGNTWLSLDVKAAGNDGRGIASVDIINGNLYITYTDSPTPVLIGALNPDSVGGSLDACTDALAFYPIGDGSTYGVKVGSAEYLDTIVIPATYNGKPVTKILARGFTNINTSTIVIPDSIIEIESEAFSGCRNLEELFIPESVQVIGYMAFAKVANVRFAIEENEIPETWDETLGYTDASFSCTRED